MTIKHIRDSAGSLSNYVWYIFISFWWYFLQNIYEAIQPAFPGSYLWASVEWLFRLLVIPFLLAGILGGIHAWQRGQESTGVSGFFKIARTHYLRTMGVILLSFVLAIIIVVVFAMVMGLMEQPVLEGNEMFPYISIPLAAITLFWLAAVIVECGKIGRSFFRAIRTLVSSPFALTVGVLWGAISFADTAVRDVLDERTVLALTGVGAGVLAFARILAGAYALAIYKKARVKIFRESSEELPISVPSASPSGDKHVKASFVLAFFSFLPPLNIIALVLSLIALKRKKRFVMRAGIACCLSGFFTAFYFLVAMGLIFDHSAPSGSPGYRFLAEVDADLEPQVILFENGSFMEAKTQLKDDRVVKESEQNWVFHCALAIAKFQTHDIDGALADFRRGLDKKPDRSEFYYYYGRALLANGQINEAGEQFQLALNHDPRIEDAKRFLALTQNTYTPTTTTTSIWFVIILLLFLFPFHEYAHAFAAWKLGDDTAKNQGRLTLNPLPHLDLFGSLILPGILLWRQSDVVFGWARPVPVNPENFADPRKDHMVVSFAGPAMNLAVSMVCFLLLGFFMLFVRIFWPEAQALNLATPSSSVSLVGPDFAPWIVIAIAFLKQLFYTSLVLGCFNLIPVPPLDGSWIFSGLLPQGARNLFEKIRPYSFLFFLLIVMTPALDFFLVIPVGLAWGLLYLCFLAMGFG